MIEPLVSVIIPTYNRAHLIAETLDAILVQTYQNWECIVVDDGSIDNTAEVMADYMTRDSRFQFYFRPKNRQSGGNAARNYGFELSKGEYVNWFDSDDLMSSDKIEIDIEHLLLSKASFTISSSNFFTNKGLFLKKEWNEQLWSEDPINDFITHEIGWGVNTPLWRKSSLVSNEILFNEELRSSQDYFFHIQALAKGLKPVVINKVLVHQRIHNEKIEHKTLKSPSKAKINLYLLKNSSELNLNEDTINVLRRRTIRILMNLYKVKNWKTAASFSFDLLLLPNVGNKSNILKLFFHGTSFKLFTKGYKFLK